MRYVKKFYKENFKKTFAADLSAGLVVFLVALPLCLGIAVASGAAPITGLITGMVGGLVVALLSGSSTSVSGPAAGLTIIVATAIADVGSYEGFLLAVVLAGIIQAIMGILKAGSIANYFPSSVIKGMLAAIGIILILGQLPHALGDDRVPVGEDSFEQTDGENKITEIILAAENSSPGAIIIVLVSLFILIIWEMKFMKKMKAIPAPLIVVILGVVINELFKTMNPEWALSGKHLVEMPVFEDIGVFVSNFNTPDFSLIGSQAVWVAAVTIAIVASLETLLSVEAVDKLDTYKRRTSKSRELLAQGIGNTMSGLIGGLPMTAVIVRGSTNVQAGSKTKFAAFIHGVFLLLAVVFFGQIIQLIPMASLAGILLFIGYKLAKVGLFQQMFKAGADQFIPFVITIIAIVFLDLLKGIGIGLGVALIMILWANMKNSFYSKRVETNNGMHVVKLVLAEEVSFLNKANILLSLDEVQENTKVIIDGTKSRYIDYDVLEVIRNFQERAKYKDIEVECINIKKSYKI